MEKMSDLELEQVNISKIPENSETDAVLTQKYEKEILPLIEILKPDDVSLEDYENQVMTDLFESVKKIQVAKGKLIESQEKILEEEKLLLYSRLGALVQDNKNNRGEESDAVLKAKAALLLSGNFDFRTLNDERYSFRLNERAVGEKIKPIFEKYIKEGNFELIASLLDSLDRSASLLGERTLYYACTPRYGSEGAGWKAETQRKILTGKMSYETFKYDKYSFENNIISQKLIPQSHYERSFFEEVASDSRQLHKLGWSRDYDDAVTGSERLMHDFLDNKDAGKFQDISDESVHQIVQMLKKKAKENYHEYDRWTIKHLFSIFTKEDFEDLIEFGISINDIDPDNLPPYLDSPIREYLVESWIQDFQKNGRDGKNLLKISRYFTITDLRMLISGGVKVNASEISVKKMKEFKEDSFILFDAYTMMSGSEQEAFNGRIAGTRFLEVLEISKFDKDQVNQLIQKIRDIAPEDINDYLEVNYDIQETISHGIYHEEPSLRQAVFDRLRKKIDFLEDKGIGVIQKGRLENIQESFFVVNEREKLPKQVFEVLERFEGQYGKKGANLVALGIYAYGIENPESFSHTMEELEKVINRYYSENIPDGAQVSMGIEYEATQSIAEEYKKESLLGYKRDIELISRSAGIDQGTGGIHEIATKPTYNPYILLAEVKLLQDAGFLDFNFKRYPNAPRGYHLSLVGREGLFVDANTYFLHNLLTMTQLTGSLAGKTILNTKDIHSKPFAIFDSSKQKGDRVEIKGMGCDTVEQFEKAVITSHYAGIAIQLCAKYFGNGAHFSESFLTLPNTAEEFEKELAIESKYAAFETDQERDIVFEWLKLQKGIVDAVDQHNHSFMDSEFNGSFFNKDGEYVDTSEYIDISRNRKLLEAQVSGFEKSLLLDTTELFRTQDINLVNALIRTNNIFLKGPIDETNSSVNAQSMLDIVKRENYQGIEDGEPTQSLFEKEGKIRDGYYSIQGASEEMISHKSQIILNNFNKAMQEILMEKSAKEVLKETI
jgi:hypothetical protein